MTKKALIDGDILIYSIGYAVQNEPNVSSALRTVNVMIEKICHATDAEEYQVYLTGSDNYRNDIATIKQYKGTRTGEKPKYYEDIKAYLIKKHEAVVTNGIEADDILSMLSVEYAPDCIICSLDKDLDMIEGKHYNWRKDKLYSVTEFEGKKHFFTQLLTGDTVDNIQGCYGIGKKKAEALLKDCTTEAEMACVVGNAYATCKHRGKQYDIPEQALIENARLLWMSRNSPDDFLDYWNKVVSS